MEHTKEPGKGGAWVWAQVSLFLAYAILPRWFPMDFPVPRLWFGAWVGAALMAYGLLMVFPAAVKLGRSLTPFPQPPPKAELVRTGPYAWVRNPIYSGLSTLALGYALWTGEGTRAILAAVIFLFLDRKSTAEEKWLSIRFPEYETYKARTKKMLPFIY